MVNFKNALDDWKVENLQGFIHYECADVPVVRTELTNEDGTVVAEISQGRRQVSRSESMCQRKIGSRHIFRIIRQWRSADPLWRGGRSFRTPG